MPTRITPHRPTRARTAGLLLALLVLPAVGLVPVRPAEARVADVSRAVVKLFVTAQGWSLSQPWTKTPVRESTCSGFFFAEGGVQGILTNAHCVADATFVEIEIQGLSDKVEAEVVAVSHDIDLALVRLRDGELHDSLQRRMPRIRLGNLPDYRDKVVTVGYPTGGRQISFTEGVVSRIDVMGMAHSNLPSLLVQTDAAINPGNSGGPVFADGSGRCLGIATQKISGGEGLGYFVPTPMIRQFLKDLEDGSIEGIPNLGFTYQTLENEALRAFLGLKAGETGVRITQIAGGSSADGVLQVDDVVLAIDGVQVFNDGQVPFRRGHRIGLGYHVFPRNVGDELPLRIARGDQRLDLRLSLRPYRFSVIPSAPAYDTEPRFLVRGGLVFLAVEPRYLWRWGGPGSNRVPTSLAGYLRMPVGENDLEELVVISSIYGAGVNKGYERSATNLRVERIDGHAIHRLADVETALGASAAKADGKDGWLVIELEGGVKVVLDRTALDREESEIRKRYNIPADRYAVPTP